MNVSNLNNVIVYDYPTDGPTLMQMIGRCNRNGSAGKAVVFLPVQPDLKTLAYRLKQKCFRKALNKELCHPNTVLAGRCHEVPQRLCCSYCVKLAFTHT